MGSDSKGSPKVRTLGAELREYRDSTGTSIRALAKVLEKHHSLLARYETGDTRPAPETVAAIMTALGASDADRTRLVELAKEAEGPNWIAVGDSSHRDMTTLVEYERNAQAIVEVATTVIPGMLQTYDYAKAIISGWSPSDADTRTAVRVGRRDVLTKTNPPQFTTIITENALREPIGGYTVHAEQMRHLLKLGALPNVEVLVVPSRQTSWSPAHAGSFIHFAFGKGSPIVYIEHFSSLSLLHSPREVKAFEAAITTLRGAAMSPSGSAELIAQIATESERT